MSDLPSPSEARKALEAAISDEYFNTPNILAAADIYASSMQQEATERAAKEVEDADEHIASLLIRQSLAERVRSSGRREGGTNV